MLKKKSTIAFIIIIIFSVIMVFQLLFGKNSLWSQRRLYNHIQALEQHIDYLKVELENEKKENARLKTDSFYLESIIRTRYGMSKSDELPVQFVDSPTHQQ